MGVRKEFGRFSSHVILHSTTYSQLIRSTLLGLIGVRVVNISLAKQGLCLQPLHRLGHYKKYKRDEVDEVKGALVCCGVLIKGQQKIIDFEENTTSN